MGNVKNGVGGTHAPLHSEPGMFGLDYFEEEKMVSLTYWELKGHECMRDPMMMMSPAFFVL